MNKSSKRNWILTAAISAVTLCAAGTAEAAAVSFRDVQPQDWYYPYVTQAVEHQLVAGYDATTFGARDTLTRAQFTAMVYHLLFKGESLPQRTDFTDVKGWAVPYVQFAKERGFIQGVGNNAFAPDRPVTREQAAAILINALRAKHQLTGALPELPLTFSDAEEVASGFRSNIALAVRLGLMSGVGENRLAPKQPMTRAEAVTLIEKCYEKGDTYIQQWKDLLSQSQGNQASSSESGNNNASGQGTSSSGTTGGTTSGGGGGGGSTGGGGGGGSSDTTAPSVLGATIIMHRTDGSEIVATMDGSNTITLSGPATATVDAGTIRVSEDCTLTITSPASLARLSGTKSLSANVDNDFPLPVTHVSLQLLNSAKPGGFTVQGTLKDKSGNTRNVSIRFVIQIQS